MVQHFVLRKGIIMPSLVVVTVFQSCQSVAQTGSPGMPPTAGGSAREGAGLDLPELPQALP